MNKSLEGENDGLFMDEMTVKDMEEAIQKTKTVIIPFGVVEQHG